MVSKLRIIYGNRPYDAASRRPGAGAAQAAAMEEYHHRALESGNHAFAVAARLLAALLVQHEEEDANTDNTRGGAVTSPTGWEGILGGFCGAPWWETLRPDSSAQPGGSGGGAFAYHP